MSDTITIAELMKTRMKELGLKRKDLVLRMGYVGINGALRELDRILEGEMPRYDQPSRIVKGLDLDISIVEQSIAETDRRLDNAWKEHERKKFEPHLYAMCENWMPTSVFAAMFSYRLRFIYLDQAFLVLSEPFQLIEVRQKIIQHMVKTRGGTPGFGHFIYFLLRRTFDEELTYFDIRGDQMKEPENAVFPYRAKFSIRVDGRKM